jgi:predicted NUDIX family NTP pyrophosphohydrolase
MSCKYSPWIVLAANLTPDFITGRRSDTGSFDDRALRKAVRTASRTARPRRQYPIVRRYLVAPCPLVFFCTRFLIFCSTFALRCGVISGGLRCSPQIGAISCREGVREIDVERGHSGLPQSRARPRGAARHPGGPFWRKKDDGAWSIPKGEIDAVEDPEQAARREFAEELGRGASVGPLQALGEVRQRGGKRVIAFAAEGEFETAALASNTFEIEWPPRSGRRQNFPEVDRAEWFDLDVARTKVLSAQVELLDRLLAIASVTPAGR